MPPRGQHEMSMRRVWGHLMYQMCTLHLLHVLHMPHMQMDMGMHAHTLYAHARALALAHALALQGGLQLIGLGFVANVSVHLGRQVGETRRGFSLDGACLNHLTSVRVGWSRVEEGKGP